MNIIKNNSWLFSSESTDAHCCRLFCFPYAGGTAEMYFSWFKKISPSTQLNIIQLPGRSYRLNEKPLDNLAEVIKQLIKCIVPYCDLPFGFFGYSLGALIAFEIARQLPIECAKNLKFFFAAARYAPQSQFSAKKIHHLSDLDFINALGALNGMPDELLSNNSFMQMLLPTLRADFSLSENYEYYKFKKLSCPIIGFGGMYDTLLPIDSMLGWAKETSSKYKLYRYPGDHFFIREYEQNMVEIINQYLMSDISETLESKIAY